VVLHLFLIAVFGVLIPYWKGADFFDPVITAAYACIGALFAGPAAAQTFSANRPQSMKEAFGKTGKAVLFGEGLVVAFLALGTATVSFTHRRLMLPELDVLAEASLLGLAAAVAVALLGGWAALRFSPMVASLMMRIVFLGLLMAFYYNARRLTDVAVQGIVLCAIATAVAVVLLRKEVYPQ
jgi:hypothetical protein